MASTTPIAILSSFYYKLLHIKMTLTYNDIMTKYFMTKQQPKLQNSSQNYIETKILA